MGKYDELVGRLQRGAQDHSGSSIMHGCVDCGLSANRCDEAATAITTLEAELAEAKAEIERLADNGCHLEMLLAAMKARGDRLAEAFLETREMLGLAEQAVCEECCPTTWKTADGRPHCKLHEDIRAVLFKHEATRDQALTEWRDQHHGGNDADT